MGSRTDSRFSLLGFLPENLVLLLMIEVSPNRGRKDFVRGSAPLDTVLPAGGSLRFRYRITIYTGKVSKERLDQDYWAYIN